MISRERIGKLDLNIKDAYKLYKENIIFYAEKIVLNIFYIAHKTELFAGLNNRRKA